MPRISRILLIEDDILFRQAIQLLFEEIDKEVILAGHGASGLEAATNQPVDLILCDFRLGDMQGDEVIRQLKSNPATRQIPVVLMTGNIAVIDVSRSGADYHLAKPFQVSELISLLHLIESR